MSSPKSPQKKVKKSMVDHTYKDYSLVDIAELGVEYHEGLNEDLFPSKLHRILSVPEHAHIIAWKPHGRAWFVVNKASFISIVLPRYFNHSNFDSFNRSVNGWGFKRLVREGPDENAYYHELFLRGRHELTSAMSRLISPGKRTPNKAEEPDFYEISRKHPLPDPLAPATLSYEDEEVTQLPAKKRRKVSDSHNVSYHHGYHLNEQAPHPMPTQYSHPPPYSWQPPPHPHPSSYAYAQPQHLPYSQPHPHHSHPPYQYQHYYNHPPPPHFSSTTTPSGVPPNVPSPSHHHHDPWASSYIHPQAAYPNRHHSRPPPYSARSPHAKHYGSERGLPIYSKQHSHETHEDHPVANSESSTINERKPAVHNEPYVPYHHPGQPLSPRHHHYHPPPHSRPPIHSEYGPERKYDYTVQSDELPSNVPYHHPGSFAPTASSHRYHSHLLLRIISRRHEDYSDGRGSPGNYYNQYDYTAQADNPITKSDGPEMDERKPAAPDEPEPSQHESPKIIDPPAPVGGSPANFLEDNNNELQSEAIETGHSNEEVCFGENVHDPALDIGSIHDDDAGEAPKTYKQSECSDDEYNPLDVDNFYETPTQTHKKKKERVLYPSQTTYKESDGSRLPEPEPKSTE